MVHDLVYKTFKKGSKTFFTSSLFFPKDIRDDIFIFYSFVRIADDYVDTVPAELEKFETFKKDYYSALKGSSIENPIINLFVEVINKHELPHEWIDAFFHSMTLDTHKKEYQTFEELDTYLYGSAEIVGLIMSKLLKLTEESYSAAQMLGKAFQYINFIRDIEEDLSLKRCYFPKEVLENYSFKNLQMEEVKKNPLEFKSFITSEVKRYNEWQKEGEKGFKFIPKKFLIPIKTASDMYAFTAKKILENPFNVYEKKIKPKKPRILAQLLYNSLTLA